MQVSQARIQRGGGGEILEFGKIIKNVKKILEVNGGNRLALKCSQEIRTETRISHFNLKGDLVGKLYVWGDIFFGGGGGGGICFMHFCPGTKTTHAESINSDLQRGLDRRLRHTQH